MSLKTKQNTKKVQFTGK